MPASPVDVGGSSYGAQMRADQVELLGAPESYGDADFVVIPSGRDDEGRGHYPNDALFLVKRLRAAGFRVAYSDPPGRRLFEARHSAVVEAIAAVGLGILTSAAWDGVKWLVQRVRRNADRSQGVELHITDARSDSSTTTLTLKGSPEDVTRMIDELQQEGVPASSPAASPESPMPGPSESGPSDDLLEARHKAEVDARVQDARDAMATARRVLAEDPPRAESYAREALTRYASALNWAEDTGRETPVHEEMDHAAAWVRRTFGCWLGRDADEYFQRCPVALGHRRVGLSVGGYARKQCSLCGQDLSECIHLPNVAYLVPGGLVDLGWCRVCLERETCEHTPDQTYRTALVSMVVEMDLEEVSIVAKPAFPDARITSMSISTSELRQALGAGFVPGMDVSCDRCLSACGGLTRPVGHATGE